MQIKITHLTSAHDRYDIRIFIKMCRSLAKNENYHVSLIVADGKGDEVKDNVFIIDAGPKPTGRLSRMTKTVNNVLRKAISLSSDIYHLHDPELMPIGKKLQRQGAKVIFDAHEDFPKQLMGKPYLNKPSKILLSKGFKLYEKLTLSAFDYVISATPIIDSKFKNINPKSTDINNYPILGELSNSTPWKEKQNEVCYVGGISEIRGIKELVNSIELAPDIRLNLVGSFNQLTLEKEVKCYPGWEKVNELGFLSREEVASVMSRSKAGLVTFHALPNHVDAQPNKMFEYMSAGLPIVTSNFPLWRDIVEGNQCGICVDPNDPAAIANAIEFIVKHPDTAKEMGKNGKKAVEEKYNWAVEENRLNRIYEQLLIG